MTQLPMLKGCPFCGGEAERFTIGDDEPNNAGGDVISCKQCGASSHVEFGRKENLVSRWNTRALASRDPDAAKLEEIALMMSEFVENWPNPKRFSTALALIAKTVRAALDPKQRADGMMTDEQIKYMANRFLGWRLPENFHPDAGISFKPTFNDHLDPPMRHNPIGTNLFDADQAEQMVRHMIEGLPDAALGAANTPDSGGE